MSIEIWKKVVGFEKFYEVSNFGNIRSLDRIDSFGRFHKGIVLRQKATRFGYNEVGLSINGVHKHAKVHRLVAEAFLENPKKKKQVNHINCIKTDNSLNNLEWVTPMENMTHAIKNGLISSVGENNPSAFLTVKLVNAIKDEYLKGVKSQRKLAFEYGVSQKTIFNIVHNRSWKSARNQ